MALETGTYISDLNASNPVNTDQVSVGDDHIRFLKSTILATFPNVAGAVTATHTEVSYLSGVTGTTGTGKITLSNGPTFTGTLNATNINASGTVTGAAFLGNMSAVNITSGQLADPRVAESNVTQHEAALTITESQISDLGSYVLTSGSTVSLINIGSSDSSLTRLSAGKIACENRAMFMHENSSFNSARIFFSNGTEPTTEGSDGDVFLVY